MRICPKCGNERSGWRLESLDEAIFGLWRCEDCHIRLNHRSNPLSDEDARNHKRYILEDIFGILLAGIIIALGLIFFETAGEMMVLLISMISVITFLMVRSMARH